MSDLFSSANDAPEAERQGAGRPPLAVRMRPRSVQELLGQERLVADGSPLRQLIEAPADSRVGPSSLILFGPPGTGKTTLAHIVSHASNRTFVELSAVTAGVKDVRQVMERARIDRDLYGRVTVLFLDEIHRFTKAQQDALLPGVENRLVVLVAATTENPSFSVISPLLSRSLLLTLESLTDDDIGSLLDRAVEDERGLNGEAVLDPEARGHLVAMAGGDARRALTMLEAAAGVTLAGGGETITSTHAQQALDRALVRYDKDGDQHYDVISAFIKSVRGSDVDASLHYLARMLEAGEDPRFIARRVMILAAEDVGMADPQALPLAVAAADSVQMLGMPEGRIPLAEAVVYLACAPKSNASYKALDAAIADVRAGKIGQVPPPLRDSHYRGAAGLGHGEGYIYAHNQPHGVATQQYPPDELVGRDYYLPGSNGREKPMAERVETLRRIVRGGQPEQAGPPASADPRQPGEKKSPGTNSAAGE